MLLQSRLSKPMEEATLTYRMKFSAGYDWTSGGKLPGLSAEGVRPCMRQKAIVSLFLYIGFSRVLFPLKVIRHNFCNKLCVSFLLHVR